MKTQIRIRRQERTEGEMVKAIIVAFLIGLILCTVTSVAESQGANRKGIIITTQPGLIKIPGNATGYPASRAKIASTALYELNETYKAVKIEKIYETIKVGNRPPEQVAVKDAYIIWFGDDQMDMAEAVSAYQGVSAILTVREK